MDSPLKYDLVRYLGSNVTNMNILNLWLKNRCFRFQFMLRVASHLNNRPLLNILPRLILKRMQRSYGIQISHRTKIGPGLLLGHEGTIVVSHLSEFGKNCNITHGVTVGGAGRKKPKGHPKLGNNVWLGTNSVIVGSILIGNNVMIAPNAFVNFDVPSDSIVIGNPAQIIPSKNATEGYIKNTLV